MEHEQLTFKETQAFSQIFLDFINQKPELKDFYGLFPNIAYFEAQIKAKKNNYDKAQRKVLHQVLLEQYEGFDIARSQIDLLLEDSTFTLTTGHQLSLFTGPLYFIYKIVTVVNLAKVLKEKYPDYNFVPLYWMASEDHDFEEINHFNLFGKKYTWESKQKGAVGRFDTNGVEQVFRAFDETPSFIKKAYTESESLAKATQKVVHELFASQGLLCLDADNSVLKGLFVDITKKEIFEPKAADLVEKTSRDLEKLGYKKQVNPREINFFYLQSQSRERIVEQENNYEVLNTNLKFSRETLEKAIAEKPENFSPNVIMRPLYQEVILPNLAYVGGPGELAYWLQLKSVFDYYELTFPILMPRNFALILNKSNAKKIDKLGLSTVDIFKDEHSLKSDFIEKNSKNDFSLKEENNLTKTLFKQIKNKTADIDQSLVAWVEAEQSKLQKSLDNIEKRLKKAEERKMDTEISQLLNLKEKLFPQSTLQERHDNFLSFYLNNSDFITLLTQYFKPFAFKFNILSER